MADRFTRFIKNQSRKKGLPPGSLVSVQDSQSQKMKLSYFDFDSSSLIEKVDTTLEDCVNAAKDKTLISWIQVEGLSDPKVLESLGIRFGITGLFLEDVLNTDHRPKLEELDDILFVIAKSLIERQANRLQFEQVSLFLGENFVLSFQEKSSPLFDPIKDRLRNNKGKIRQSGADYLFYALLDSVVDNYFSTLETLGKDIEGLEEMLDDQNSPRDMPQRILKLRTDILYLNRAVFPLRETLSHLRRVNRPDIEKQTLLYIHDTYEHSVYIVDVVENYRQLLNSMMETFESILNQRTNEIIKFLTIFSAFFIPLTFIVGVYGMNFDYFPELKWRYSYLSVWGVMLSITIGLYFFFKRKKWV